MRLWVAVAGLAAAAAVPQSGAQPFDYSADRDPALRACDAHYHRGDRPAAAACYAMLASGSNDAAVRAETAWRMGDPVAANAFFRTGVELDPESVALRNRWGRLFLATHQNDEAVRLFMEALELDENYVPAKLGLAAVAAGRFEDRARSLVEEVIEGGEENLEAYLISAQMSLELGALATARNTLDKALEIAEAEALPPLEVYALYAAADVLEGIADSEWTQRALAYNPGYGDIYATPAHFYLMNRRYREAVDLLFEAVAIQPDLWSAQEELGVNLLRRNRVEEARAHLALAYRGDPYSAQTVNTLRLIDSFDNFRVLSRELPAPELPGAELPGAELPGPEPPGPELPGPEPPGPEGEPSAETTAASPAMLLRLHEDEAEVLDPYVTDLVGDSIRTFAERYRFELREPVVVELYPEHDDFAVRTLGLPGIGLLGVAFGYLVAMDSPAGSRQGEFHWGTTLWHEMAHVFTLEATANLVPRWYSEGVSVFEEWSSGPLRGRHIPVRVLEAMAEDRFLPVTELDGGFMRPTYDGQVIVSYTQGGLICEYIHREWGQQGLVDVLERFAEGLDTAAAIREGLEVSPETFDRGFKEYLETEFRATLDVLDEWKGLVRSTYEAMDAADWEAAIDAADAAIAAFPDYVGEGDAYTPKALGYEELDRRQAALETYETYWRLGGYSPLALGRLGTLLHEAGRVDDAIAVYRDLIMVTPLDADVHTALGDWMLARGVAAGALREYRALLAMAPHDMAGVHYRLATAYLALEDRPRTREHLLYALETAPHYREAQQLLLEIVR